MILTAGSGVSFSFEWRKAFLHYASYPPDPHRGFHIPPGVLVITFPAGRETQCREATGIAPLLQALSCATTPGTSAVTTRYTEALLVMLPTPDFSTCRLSNRFFFFPTKLLFSIRHAVQCYHADRRCNGSVLRFCFQDCVEAGQGFACPSCSA